MKKNIFLIFQIFRSNSCDTLISITKTKKSASKTEESKKDDSNDSSTTKSKDVTENKRDKDKKETVSYFPSFGDSDRNKNKRVYLRELGKLLKAMFFYVNFCFPH